MGLMEQMETFLEHVEQNLYDFGDRFARGRIDMLLSTLNLLGIRERLPEEHSDRVLADLEDVEGIDEADDNPHGKSFR